MLVVLAPLAMSSTDSKRLLHMTDLSEGKVHYT